MFCNESVLDPAVEVKKTMFNYELRADIDQHWTKNMYDVNESHRIYQQVKHLQI